jgi:N-acetylglutamate synthase-like GNAT family acetyltransferase
MKIKKIDYNNKNEWLDFQNIYNENFNDYERAPIEEIKKNINLGMNEVYLVEKNKKSVGFFILSNSKTNDFSLLWYLGVAKNTQGKGIGNIILDQIIKDFQTKSTMSRLFLEAEQRQSIWYSKKGFSRINHNYKYPSYDTDDMSPTNLMMIEKKPTSIIKKETLKAIVSDLYENLYGLQKDDQNFINEINNINKDIKVINKSNKKNIKI